MLSTLSRLCPRSPTSIKAALATLKPSISTSAVILDQKVKENFTKSKHFKSDEILSKASDKNTQDYLLPHPIWTQSEVESVRIEHKAPKGLADKAAFYSVTFLRKSFDLASGYTLGQYLHTLDERAVLIRCIFLETVAGVPGFSAAMIRHAVH